MPVREYVDDRGVRWHVWNVAPWAGAALPRASEDRRAGEEPGVEAERRSGVERRVMRLTPGLEQGWLCFESASEVRRLVRVPDDWTSCPEEALQEYCRAAIRVPMEAPEPPQR